MIKLSTKVQAKVLDSLYDLETYYMDDGVINDERGNYSKEERREHHGKMKKLGRLIQRLSIEEVKKK